MSIFKNDGNNPLVAVGMVLALAVVPMALMAGIVGGAAWLGWVGAKAAIAIATTGTAAGVLSPGAAVGAVLGGAALLAAGHYTGALQGLGYMFKKYILRKDPDAEPPRRHLKPAPKPWNSRTGILQKLNISRRFGKAAKKPGKDAATPPEPLAAQGNRRKPDAPGTP